MPSPFRDRLANVAFPQPADAESKVWRYMSLAKLISLLQTRTLFLCRLDLLSDPYEGSLPKLTHEERTKYLAASGIGADFAASILNPVSRITRASSYVNCWNLSEYESEALWRLYGAIEDGVAVQARYRSLVDVIRPEDELFVGMIRYIDYDTHSFEWADSFQRIMHKGISFEHEREVRFATIPAERISASDHAQNPPGITVPIDVEALVENLYISPYCKPWYRDVVVGVVGKFAPGLVGRIKWSPMKALPRF